LVVDDISSSLWAGMTAQLVEQGDVRGVDGEVLGLDSGKIAFLGLCPPMGRHSILPLTEENPQIAMSGIHSTHGEWRMFMPADEC
jgi:hypothetical protein